MRASDDRPIDGSPEALAPVVEANINAQLPLMYAHMPGVEVIDESGLLGMMAHWPDPLVNSVYWAAFPREQVEARIDQVLDRFRRRGRLPLTWVVSPGTQPRDLGRHLEAQGFARVSRGLGMAVALDAVADVQPAPAGLVVERVRDVEGLQRWLHPVRICFSLRDATALAYFDLLASQGFGGDVPWTLFTGMVDGRPVSASRVFCTASVAGIYQVATLPQARRQGFGTAMVLAAVRAARESGCHAAILTASAEGHELYRRLGFEDCCRADIYLGPAEVPAMQ